MGNCDREMRPENRHHAFISYKYENFEHIYQTDLEFLQIRLNNRFSMILNFDTSIDIIIFHHIHARQGLVFYLETYR